MPNYNLCNLVLQKETIGFHDRTGGNMSQTIRSVKQALDAMFSFSRQTPELSISQIYEDVGLHESSVHRLLATLEGKQFVERYTLIGVYRLGINMLHLAISPWNLTICASIQIATYTECVNNIVKQSTSPSLTIPQ